MRIRSGALRFSTASPEPIEMGSADAMVVDVMATVCAITGVRAAPTLGQPIWNTLADNACSSHINSLAPAVALPAPRHDRRRTGAAGSPPGGFPFLEGRLLSCRHMCADARCPRARDRLERAAHFFRASREAELSHALICSKHLSSGRRSVDVTVSFACTIPNDRAVSWKIGKADAAPIAGAPVRALISGWTEQEGSRQGKARRPATCLRPFRARPVPRTIQA